MADFSNLRKAATSGEARPYAFTQLGLDPVPTVFSMPATEDNKPFFNETLRRSAERSSQGSSRPKALTADRVAATRDEDRELLANMCATGWKNVQDAKGAEVEFSAEECHEFFKALPDWVFDEYRAWAVKDVNFIVPADAGALGER